MSVALSTTISNLFSITYIGHNALQILGFRDIQQDWVVLGLSSAFDDPQAPVNVAGRLCHNFKVLDGTDVIRAAAGDEDAARPQHLERPQI
jgi:hypothetical protein